MRAGVAVVGVEEDVVVLKGQRNVRDTMIIMTRDTAMMGTMMMDIGMEGIMGTEDVADTAFRGVVEAVVDLAVVAVADEVAAVAVVRVQTKPEMVTQLPMQMRLLVTEKKGPQRVVQIPPMLPTILLQWCKHPTVEAAEAMVEEDDLDAGVVEDAAEEEPM